MNTPLFSFIVPVYGVEEYLPRCVDSLLAQTCADFEVILVDDGSPDRCPALCDAYAARDARVRVIHQENGGLSAARNAGMNAAAGTYLIFVDSDDCVTPDYCAGLLPFTAAGDDILVCDALAEGAEKKLSHVRTDARMDGMRYLWFALSHNAMPIAAWLYVYRRAFLLAHELRFLPGITHEDEEFVPRTFLAAASVADTGVCAYRYLVREGSITTAPDLRRNARDFYATCLALRARYLQLEDAELRRLLLDSLVVKYLSLFQRGALWRWGREYIHKKFVRENAFTRKTKMKAALFGISPRLYWHINALTKR